MTDGQVTELPEYLDAWGFVQVAKDQGARLADASRAAADAIAAALAPADALFPDLVPDGKVSGDPSVLLGAAARIEIAGLGL